MPDRSPAPPPIEMLWPRPRRSAAGLLREAVHELRGRRELIGHMVRTDIRRIGADTVLGSLWWLLDPVFLMLTFLFLFAVVFERKVPDFPLFVFTGVVPWKWFSSAVSDAATCVVTQERLMRQATFPRLVLPVASVCATTANLGVGLLALGITLVVFYPTHLSTQVLLVPLLIATQFTLTLGIAIAASAATVFVRDLGNLIRHVVRMLYHLAPVLWALSRFEGEHHGPEAVAIMLIRLDPLAILFDGWHHALYGDLSRDSATYVVGADYDLGPLLILLAGSLLLLAGATVLFKRLEPSFVKVL